jgi:hypothetical protein
MRSDPLLTEIFLDVMEQAGLIKEALRFHCYRLPPFREKYLVFGGPSIDAADGDLDFESAE